MTSFQPTRGVLELTASVGVPLTISATINADNPDAYMFVLYPHLQSGDLVHTRGTPAAYVDSEGQIQMEGADAPRASHYHEDGS